MATFEPYAKSTNRAGYSKIYIRVTVNRNTGYLPTHLIAYKDQMNGHKIKDIFLITEIAPIIKDYMNRLNKQDTSNWTLQEVMDFVKKGTGEVSFTDFYQKFINKMINSGRDNPAMNYKSAINSLKLFSGKDSLTFSDITSKLINDWIDSMSHFKRVKNLYPTCVSTVFTAGMKEFNDYDRDVIRIKNQPFMRVDIPSNEVAEKKAIDKAVLLKLFNADISGAVLYDKTPRAKDVALMIFCLAGINVADLYYMEHDNRIGNQLSYIRWKTKDKRKENGRMVITIPERILPLFEKYKGSKRLLSFSDTIRTEKNFLKCVDMGLKELSTIAKVDKVSTYVFRHSFATIAQNNCGASDELVAFCLNHASAHKVTTGYIKKDYTPIDKLVKKVITYTFK